MLNIPLSPSISKTLGFSPIDLKCLTYKGGSIVAEIKTNFKSGLVVLIIFAIIAIVVSIETSLI